MSIYAYPCLLELIVVHNQTLKERTKELLRAVPITEIVMSPSIFSEERAGDLFDGDVCRDCWERAIDSCEAL